MLPIIPNSKKGTSTRKKRPRILPSASAASKKKKSNIVKQPTSKASASLKDDTSTTQEDDTTKQQHEPITLNNNNANSNVNEEEDTLLLAAEAAAALMDDLPNSLPANDSTANNDGIGVEDSVGGNNNGSGLDYADIPMNLLDEVNNSVEYAASMMTKEQQLQNDSSDTKEGVQEKEADNNSTTKEGGLKVPYLPPIQYNNNIETSSNPLGNEVISFESKLPDNQSNESTSIMSTVQKNFLNHYYYNGLNEGSGDKSVLLNGNNSSLKRVGDKSEEDEEIVEEDNGTTATKQKKGKENKKEGEEPSLPNEEEEGAADQVVALTLRTVCASIPRTIKKKNKKNKNLNLKNEGENSMIMEEEEAAAMGTADKETATSTAGRDKDTTDKAQAPTAEEEAATKETPDTATGPQVKVNEQGEIVIEQESLLPNPETRQSTAQIDQELGNTVIDEGETPSQLGAIQARYDSYTSQPRQIPTRWSVTETKSFYRALRQCGTDFSMMEMFLVGRTRSQLKRKFKIESRKNARLIDMALNPRQKVKLDLSVFGDNLVIPTEVPAIKVLPPVEDNTVAAVGKKGQRGTEKRKSVEKSFDHLFEEEEEDGEGNDDTAVADSGDKIDESVQKGKSEEVSTQSTAVVPPVIAAAKSTTSKTKAKKAFKPKVKPRTGVKPKKIIKKTAAASVKK